MATNNYQPANSGPWNPRNQNNEYIDYNSRQPPQRYPNDPDPSYRNPENPYPRHSQNQNIGFNPSGSNFPQQGYSNYNNPRDPSNYSNYPNQNYGRNPNQGYPNQGYPNQSYPNQNYPNQNFNYNQNYPNYQNSPNYTNYGTSNPNDPYYNSQFPPFSQGHNSISGHLVSTDPNMHRGQNFLGQTSGIEAMSSNNYYFYYIIEPIISKRPKKLAEESDQEKAEALRKKLEEDRRRYKIAEENLNYPPMPDTIRRISKFIIKLGFDPLRHFIKIDKEEKGEVIKKQFLGLMTDKWGLIRNSIVSEEEIDKIAEIFDIYSKGVFLYPEFCKKIQNPEYRLDGQTVAKFVDFEWKDRVYKDIAGDVYRKVVDEVRVLQAEIMKNEALHGGNSRRPKNRWDRGRDAEANFDIYERMINFVDKAFKDLDKSSYGTLDLTDFVTALNTLTKKLNFQEISLLSDQFDFRHNQIIEYPLFITALEGYLSKKSTYEAILSQLAQFCQDYKISLPGRLSKYDPRSTNQVHVQDFKSILQEINFNYDSYSLETFLSEITRTKEDLLDLRFVLARIPVIKEPFDISSIYTKIKNFLVSRNQSLPEIFSKLDKNGDGSLGFYEFTQALGIMGISDISARDIALVIQDLDTDKDGSISLAEFADKLSMSLEMLQTRINLKFFRKIKKFLIGRGKRLVDLFTLFDYDRSASLSKREFYRMIASFGISVHDDDVDDLFHEIDVNRDGVVSFMEFVAKYEKTIKAIEQRDVMIKAKVVKEIKKRPVREVFVPTFNSETGIHAFYNNDLWTALSSLGIELTEDDYEVIIEEITQGKSYADLDDILVYIGLQKPNNKTQTPREIGGQQQGKDQASLPKWAEKWLKQIKSYSRSRKIELNSLITPYNRDKSGKLMIPEFVQLLKDTTTSLKKEDQEGLINYFKQDQKIEIQKLILTIEELYSPVDELIELLKDFFNSTGRRISEVFIIDENAQISKENFFRGFAVIDRSIESFEINEFMAYLNPDFKNSRKDSRGLMISASVLAKTLDLQGVNMENFSSPRTVTRKSLKKIYDLIAEYVIKKDIYLKNEFGDRYDRYGTNKVNVNEFCEVIFYIVEDKLSDLDLKIIIDDLDKFESGLINYSVFIGKIEDFIILNNFIERFFIRLKKDAIELELDLSSSFRDHSLFYTLNELYDELLGLKLFVDREELVKVFQKLDYEEIGKIQIGIFIKRLYSSGFKKRSKSKKTQKFSLPSYKSDGLKKNSSREKLAPTSKERTTGNPLQGGGKKEKKFKKKFRGPKQHWARYYFKLIKDYANSQQKSLKQVFLEFDLDKSGSLSRVEFRKAFEKLGVPISHWELEMLIEELDSNKNGRISLIEFEAISGDRVQNERLEAFLEDIREVIFRQHIDIRKLFIQADLQESNYVTYEEFMDIITSFYHNITRNDLYEIAKYLDLDQDHKLFYYEFIGRMMIDEIEKLNKKFVKIIRKKDIDLELIFRNFDTKKDKCLHFNVFMKAFQTINLPFSREEHAKVILENPIHRTRDQRYSYEDLLEILDLKREENRISKINYVNLNNMQLSSQNDGIYLKIYEVCDRNCFDIQMAFKDCDTGKDGKIGMEAFMNGLRKFRILLTEFEYNSIFTELDRTKIGKIDVQEFFKRVLKDSVKVNLAQLNFAAPIMEKIRDYIEERQLDTVTFFKRFYLGKDGTISLYNFYGVLRFMDISPEDEKVQKMIGFFKTPSNDSVNFKDFEFALRHLTEKIPRKKY